MTTTPADQVREQIAEAARLLASIHSHVTGRTINDTSSSDLQLMAERDAWNEQWQALRWSLPDGVKLDTASDEELLLATIKMHAAIAEGLPTDVLRLLEGPNLSLGERSRMRARAAFAETCRTIFGTTPLRTATQPSTAAEAVASIEQAAGGEE